MTCILQCIIMRAVQGCGTVNDRKNVEQAFITEKRLAQHNNK